MIDSSMASYRHGRTGCRLDGERCLTCFLFVFIGSNNNLSNRNITTHGSNNIDSYLQQQNDTLIDNLSSKVSKLNCMLKDVVGFLCFYLIQLFIVK